MTQFCLALTELTHDSASAVRGRDTWLQKCNCLSVKTKAKESWSPPNGGRKDNGLLGASAAELVIVVAGHEYYMYLPQVR